MNRLWLLLLPLLLLSPAWAEDKVKLEEVVVTATRTEELAENVAQDVTIITKEEIDNGSHTTIADVLKNVIALNIRENGSRGAIATVSLRGSTVQQTLILIDGKRLNKPGDGQVDLNTLPITLDNIERIEILRGASSSLYGADAMGGVVNIITKIPSEPITRISSSYGRFSTWNSTITSSKKIGDFGYLISAERETSQGFRRNSDYALWNLNSKITLDLSKDFHISMNADYSHKEAGAPGLSAFPSPMARQWDENSMFGATVKFKDTIAKFYNNNSRIHFIDPNPMWPTNSTHKNHVLGADIQSSFELSSSNLLTAGVELIEEDIDSTIIGSKTRTRKGIFIQDDISFFEKLIFNIGARYDDFGEGSRLTPRGSVLYKITNDMTVRLSVGGGYRIPTMNDLYWIEDWGWGMGMFGNPDLKPEKSIEYELSFEQSFYNKKIKAKALVFQKDAKDLIKWTEVGLWRWEPQNIADAKIRGFEYTVNADFDKINFLGSYFYQDPLDRETGERIYDLPRHQVTGGFSVFPLKGTTLSFEGKYVSNYIKSDAPTWCYFVLDGKLSQKFPLSFGEAELYIVGKNLLNKDYETSRGYPMPPVVFSGGITVRF